MHYMAFFFLEGAFLAISHSSQICCATEIGMPNCGSRLDSVQANQTGYGKANGCNSCSETTVHATAIMLVCVARAVAFCCDWLAQGHLLFRRRISDFTVCFHHFENRQCVLLQESQICSAIPQVKLTSRCITQSNLTQENTKSVFVHTLKRPEL